MEHPENVVHMSTCLLWQQYRPHEEILEELCETFFHFSLLEVTLFSNLCLHYGKPSLNLLY